MIDDPTAWPDNDNARQGPLAGVRTTGRITHPAIAGGTTDATTSAVPVPHDSGLGPRAQGGRTGQPVRFPT
jgi:hypothetical protein